MIIDKTMTKTDLILFFMIMLYSFDICNRKLSATATCKRHYQFNLYNTH
jgi:hypothetical protein